MLSSVKSITARPRASRFEPGQGQHFVDEGIEVKRVAVSAMVPIQDPQVDRVS